MQHSVLDNLCLCGKMCISSKGESSNHSFVSVEHEIAEHEVSVMMRGMMRGKIVFAVGQCNIKAKCQQKMRTLTRISTIGSTFFVNSNNPVAVDFFPFFFVACWHGGNLKSHRNHPKMNPQTIPLLTSNPPKLLTRKSSSQGEAW